MITRLYKGAVALSHDAMKRLVPVEWAKLVNAETRDRLADESDYSDAVADANGSGMQKDAWRHPELSEAIVDVLTAAKDKGFNLDAGYVYNEVEASIVFILKDDAITTQLTAAAQELFSKHGFSIDDITFEPEAIV